MIFRILILLTIIFGCLYICLLSAVRFIACAGIILVLMFKLVGERNTKKSRCSEIAAETEDTENASSITIQK